MSNGRQLRRSKDDKMIAGVAAGVAHFFGLNVSLIRVIWVITAVFGGMTLLIYVILWLVIPEESLGQADGSPAEEE